MSKSGQFSIEFSIVLGMLILLVASVTIPTYTSARDDATHIAYLSAARQSGLTIAGAMNMVYSSGVGSRMTVDYWLPPGLDGIYIAEDADGAGRTPADNCADVQFFLIHEADNVVVVDTILPSTNHDSWSGYPLIDSSLTPVPGHHVITVEYKRPDVAHENLWIELAEA